MCATRLSPLSSLPFFNQNTAYSLKNKILNCHSLNIRNIVGRKNPERVVVFEMLAPAIFPRTIIPRSKSLKSFVLPILTCVRRKIPWYFCDNYVVRHRRSLYKQFFVVTLLYVTVRQFYFPLSSNLLTTQCTNVTNSMEENLRNFVSEIWSNCIGLKTLNGKTIQCYTLNEMGVNNETVFS